MTITYDEFKSKLEAFAESLRDFTNSIDAAPGVEQHQMDIVKDNARRYIDDMCEAIRDDFGECLDD